MDEPPPLQEPIASQASAAHAAETVRSGGAGLEREAEAARGQLFGPFRVVGTLGRGGMGVVYEGEHADGGGRVAIKAVRAPQPWMLGSIRREIQALATLDHPGIVRIVAEGVMEGMPWYAMPLLPGITLAGRRVHPSGDATGRGEAVPAGSPAGAARRRRRT